MHYVRRLSLFGLSMVPLFVGVGRQIPAQTVQRYIVMRVDFANSGTTAPRYTKQQVVQLLDSVTTLFTQNSNNNVKVEFVVTDIFRLPKNNSAYGATSLGTAIADAIASAPSAVTALWSNDVHAIMVLLS